MRRSYVRSEERFGPGAEEGFGPEVEEGFGPRVKTWGWRPVRFLGRMRPEVGGIRDPRGKGGSRGRRRAL